MNNTSNDADPYDILLIEDREADIELTRLGLAECRIRTTLHSVRDGFEALAFLRREGRFQAAPRPQLILLDLNLPRIPGRDVLAELKNDSQFKWIPVVILTTSMDEGDVKNAYLQHANAYLVKPLTFDRLVELLGAITDYWFKAVTLPPLC